jgi:hypothetical protein
MLSQVFQALQRVCHQQVPGSLVQAGWQQQEQQQQGGSGQEQQVQAWQAGPQASPPLRQQAMAGAAGHTRAAAGAAALMPVECRA